MTGRSGSPQGKSRSRYVMTVTFKLRSKGTSRIPGRGERRRFGMPWGMWSPVRPSSALLASTTCTRQPGRQRPPFQNLGLSRCYWPGAYCWLSGRVGLMSRQRYIKPADFRVVLLVGKSVSVDDITPVLRHGRRRPELLPGHSHPAHRARVTALGHRGVNPRTSLTRRWSRRGGHS